MIEMSLINHIIMFLKQNIHGQSFWQSELEFHVSDKADTTLDWEKLSFRIN